jgi:Flp pilus assembly protein TadD
LKAEGNAVCTQCHNAAGNPRFPTLKARTYDAPEHHFHTAGSDGARCTSCHMPSRNYMVVHARPDHSFRIPRPDQSEKLGTPNACNQCHAKQPASWAAAAIAKWYGPQRRQEPGFAEAFAAARAGRREAIPALVAIIRDPAQPAIVRASAVQLLPLSSEAALAAAIEARHDGEGLVRAAAVEALAGQPPQQRAFLLAPLLRDPLRLVRIEAARALATLPPGTLPDSERAAYDGAFAEFMQAQAASADMPASNLGMANLHSLRGEDAKARELYTRTLKMDPFLAPASSALASHLSASGDSEAAAAVLREGLRRSPNDGSLHYALGLLLAESGKMAEAARELGTASRLLPADARAAYNHGLALQQLGKPRDAEAALRKAYSLDAGDPAYAYALAVLLMREGRPQAALPYAERFAELDPGNPQARQLLATLRRGQP